MQNQPLLDRIQAKIYQDRSSLKQTLISRHAGQKVVFTNGCFDLLHKGHIHTLSRARDLGDLLIVGLNSDDSVRRLKGPSRPVNSQLDRAFLLSALCCVDYVTLFAEDTPVETIRILAPSIHVKGGDYRAEDLPEKEAVESQGGKIVVLPFEKGYSTTQILERGT